MPMSPQQSCPGNRLTCRLNPPNAWLTQRKWLIERTGARLKGCFRNSLDSDESCSGVIRGPGMVGWQMRGRAREVARRSARLYSLAQPAVIFSNANWASSVKQTEPIDVKLDSVSCYAVGKWTSFAICSTRHNAPHLDCTHGLRWPG